MSLSSNSCGKGNLVVKVADVLATIPGGRGPLEALRRGLGSCQKSLGFLVSTAQKNTIRNPSWEYLVALAENSRVRGRIYSPPSLLELLTSWMVGAFVYMSDGVKTTVAVRNDGC